MQKNWEVYTILSDQLSPGWIVDNSESFNVSQEYVDDIGNQIDSYYE
jgi:hypothetical protein